MNRNFLTRYTEKFRHLFARSGEKVSLSPLLLSILTRREQQNDLPWLTPERATDLYSLYRRGNLAEIQLTFDQLEEYDETLFTVLSKRQRALAAMPRQVVIDASAVGDDPQKQRLAEQQKAYLEQALLAVENLDAALLHLGMADFRGVAALEVTGREQRERWEVIEPWNLARPSRRGPWLYNPKADPSCTCLETLRPERCIIREERPIDLPVMFLIVDKIHAVKGWDTFLDVFGSPSIFLELPPSTSEEKALEFDRRVQQIVSDGRGTIPNGAKFQTVETTADNSGSFETRAKWCREAIITIATGGLLTVETQAGSGTLAGNAHAESFNELCAGSAASIAQVVNMQWCRPRLAGRFPGSPVLARFDFSPEKEDDLTEQAQLIATLSSAGFRPSAETVSEMMGFEVQAVESTPAAPSPFTPGLPPITNSATASGSEPNSDIVHRPSSIVHDPASAPLTEQELAALQSLSKGFAPDQLEADADTLYTALANAIAPEEAQEKEPVANSCNQYGHEEGCSGASRHEQKGTTREEKTPGETKKVYKLDQRQSMHNQIRDLSQIIERSSRDGEHMEAVLYRPEFGELTLDCGRPGRKNDSTDSHGHGVKHALEERHKISPQQIAQTLLKGKVEQHESSPSRLYVSLGDHTVVLEREIQAGSKRSSSTRAKLHTAYAGKK